MEIRTEYSMNREDHDWLVREAKLRGVPHTELLRDLINLAGVSVHPGSKADIRRQLDQITRNAIKLGRQATTARDN